MLPTHVPVVLLVELLGEEYCGHVLEGMQADLDAQRAAHADRTAAIARRIAEVCSLQNGDEIDKATGAITRHG